MSLQDGRAAVLAARQRFPDIVYSEVSFAEDVRHLDLSRLELERVCDLFLAFACVRGEPNALAWFERTIMKRLEPALARLDPRPDVVDEARQQVRERLLVASAARPPRLAEYRGEAPLWSWVKTVAVRLRIDAARADRLAVDEEDEGLAERLVTSGRLDLRFLQEAHRAQVTRAFSEALAALTPRDRTLLRLAHLEGQSIDRLAALYDTHRATAARWLVAARAQLVNGTRDRLQRTLRLEGAELDSFLQALDGQLERSLRHYFDDAEA